MDRYKDQIRDLKTHLKSLLTIEVKHDLFKDQLNDIQIEKVKSRMNELKEKEKRRLSIIGHLEDSKGPVMITLSFLGTKDMFQLQLLSKEVRSSFLSNVSACKALFSFFRVKMRMMDAEIEQRNMEIENKEKDLR